MKRVFDILWVISAVIFFITACLLDSEPFIPIVITLVLSGVVMFTGLVFMERRYHGSNEFNQV